MSGTPQLIFTLEGDQGQIAANFGPYLPIQVAGTLQQMLDTIEQTETSVQNAMTASAAATTDAANAATSATAAATSASNAATSESNASASASAAASSASSAATSASTAGTSAANASTSAQQAANSALTVATMAPLTPTTDNTLSLGTSTRRYSNMYAVNFQGVASSALYADLAERYQADCYMEPGDVVMLGGEKEITKTNSAYCPNVFGVVSTAPAFKMNAGAGDDSTHPYVALAGRIPVKVVGKAKKGQRLVSSGVPGVAMAVDLSDVTSFFAVIGRVLADKTSDEIDLVEAVVGAK
ncbi:hypothetical protein [Caballeronia zhejiangensis]|uniref:hypothetical protein n=1 Tax=Caballeronia zhejiangensis TaxID=871203 RepID=UPI001F51C911|nr:hypothetical protein [Caballeronia zhejiangensis]MCI1046956.1 hypothetical protein [Caballeronia zhejiangensis]